MLLVQIAFASGPLPPAVAAMSVTNPVASFVLGILAFDAPAPRDPGVLSAIAVSGVLIALGIVGVANASSTRRLYRDDVEPGDPSRARLTPIMVAMQLTDAVVLVTGASAGIGHATAPASRRGARVLVHGRDAERTRRWPARCAGGP